MSGSTRVSRYQKGKTKKVKTNLDLLEQEVVSGSDICWAICKSAPHPRQPRQHPTTQFFTGQMPFLSPNQQRQSTEGTRQSTKSANIFCIVNANSLMFSTDKFWLSSMIFRSMFYAVIFEVNLCYFCCGTIWLSFCV